MKTNKLFFYDSSETEYLNIFVLLQTVNSVIWTFEIPFWADTATKYY